MCCRREIILSEEPESPNLIFSQAQDIHAAEIVHLQMAAWQRSYKGFISEDILKTRVVTPERIEKIRVKYIDKKRLFIVQKNHKIVAFGTLGDVISAQTEIDIFYVHPDWQRQGIGYFLLKNLFHLLRGEQCQKAVIWTLKNYPPSNQFYTKMGGQKTFNEKKGPFDLVLTEYIFDLTQ